MNDKLVVLSKPTKPFPSTEISSKKQNSQQLLQDKSAPLPPSTSSSVKPPPVNQPSTSLHRTTSSSPNVQHSQNSATGFSPSSHRHRTYARGQSPNYFSMSDSDESSGTDSEDQRLEFKHPGPLRSIRPRTGTSDTDRGRILDHDLGPNEGNKGTVNPRYGEP